MSKTETKTAVAVNLELPPDRGSLSVTSTMDEDAHYLRVTLDKSENFKVAAGKRLRDMLVDKFAGNRNALRDWYEENVVQGKAHRAWGTVERYLGTVLRHGEEAAAVFASQEEKKREQDAQYIHVRRERPFADENDNDLNRPKQPRAVKSEYERRAEWLSLMDYNWFKGNREWQDKWLQNRRLLRDRGSD